MGFYLTKFISAWIIPPGVVLLFLFIAILLFKKYKKASRFFLITGTSLLLIFSLPIFSNALVGFIEIYPPLSEKELKENNAQAIVILGGGRYRKAPEYGDATVNFYTLERIRYGAHVSKITGLPVLVTGGALPDSGKTEAELMALTLIHDYDITPKWIENRSLDTNENAEYSQALLKKDRINKIFLVTHAAHMIRSKRIFEQRGLEVIPAPTRFQGFTGNTIEFFDFLPSVKALDTSYYAVHEIIGTIWYWIAH